MWWFYSRDHAVFDWMDALCLGIMGMVCSRLRVCLIYLWFIHKLWPLEEYTCDMCSTMNIALSWSVRNSEMPSQNLVKYLSNPWAILSRCEHQGYLMFVYSSLWSISFDALLIDALVLLGCIIIAGAVTSWVFSTIMSSWDFFYFL